VKPQQLLLTVALFALAACAPANEPHEQPATPVATPTVDDALAADAQWYAEEFQVSFEEAYRRLQLQESVGQLNVTLTAQERESFAGLWIQNTPEYAVVVAFTADGEETIPPYIEGQPFADEIEVRTHRYTLAELRAAQGEVNRILEQLGLGAAHTVSVQENQVMLEVGNPALFMEEVHAAGLELPEPVEVVAIDPQHTSETNRGMVVTYTLPAEQTLYFPKQPPRVVYPEGDYVGRLVLDKKGCLRLHWEYNGHKYVRLILWRYDFTARVAEGTVEILNEDGQVVARVGDVVEVGGGETDYVEDMLGMPLEHCSGPYLQMGAIERE
jgi:hypothetical protein